MQKKKKNCKKNQGLNEVRKESQGDKGKSEYERSGEMSIKEDRNQREMSQSVKPDKVVSLANGGTFNTDPSESLSPKQSSPEAYSSEVYPSAV